MRAHRLPEDTALFRKTRRMIAREPYEKICSQSRKAHVKVSREGAHDPQDCGFGKKPRFALLYQSNLRKRGNRGRVDGDEEVGGSSKCSPECVAR